VFKDTPGYLRIENAKEERLDSSLLQTAAVEMQDVDFTLLVIDAARTLTETYEHALVQLMIGALHSEGRIEDDDDDDMVDDDDSTNKDEDSDDEYNNDFPPTAPPKSATAPKFAVVLNKVDLIKDKEQLIPFAEHIGRIADACLQDYYGPSIMDDTKSFLDVAPITFYVSALNEDGTDDILDYLLEMATPSKSWAVPLGQTTNLTTEERICEVIREKIYRCTHREVPHSVEQINRVCERRHKPKTTSNRPQTSQDILESQQLAHGAGMLINGSTWNDNDIMVIHQDLVVFTKSHQRLVLGSSGRTLQRIQETAQRDLQTIFRCDVALSLKVKLNKSKQRRRAGE
jgi:GTP-binding protein Era